MSDPRPVLVLVLVEVGALVILSLWWLSLPAAVRLRALEQVWRQEQVTTRPPLALPEQPRWLFQHRKGLLQGMVGLGVLALLLGACEGILRRRRDVHGGFLLAWWTTGVVGMGVLVGGVGATLALPWPLPCGWVAAGLATIVGLVGYGLMAGRPFVK